MRMASGAWLLVVMMMMVAGAWASGAPGTAANATAALAAVEAAPTRFDYRLSFKSPYLLSDKTLPHFATRGDVTISHDFIRLVSSLPLRRGSIWSTRPNPHPEWSLKIKFSVAGRGNVGGEGFVLWYVSKTDLEGAADFYGHSSSFKGFAVVFDTSDIVNHRYNPFIYLVENDGKKTASSMHNYMSSKSYIGACYREYRNTPGPVYARLSYLGGVLSLDLDLRQEGKSYTNCFSADMPNIPTGYFFGISASTDEASADDHDLVSFKTYELNPKPPVKKLRPFEQQDINQGKEFHIDETIKKEIDESIVRVKRVEEAESAHDPHEELVGATGVTPETIEKLEENQFKIIEALNILEQKIGVATTMPATHDKNSKPLTPTHQAEFEARMTSKLDIIKSEISILRDELRALTQKSTEARQSAYQLLQAINSRLTNAHDIVQSTSEKIHTASAERNEYKRLAGAVYYALYIFAGISGVTLAILVVRAYSGSKERERKKFI